MWGVLDMVKCAWRLWVVNKESITPCKKREHPMWSHRMMILEVFGQSRVIIRKKNLISHQLNHHLQIEIHKDKWMGLTYFHAYSSSEILFDWKIEFNGNLPLMDILIIFHVARCQSWLMDLSELKEFDSRINLEESKLIGTPWVT